MKFVSRLYSSLTPAELRLLKNRANAQPSVSERIPRNALPSKVENYALAMKLPLEKVRQMYPAIAPNRPILFRLRNIATRLRIKVPKKQKIRSNYHSVVRSMRKKSLAKKMQLSSIKATNTGDKVSKNVSRAGKKTLSAAKNVSPTKAKLAQKKNSFVKKRISSKK